MTQMELDVTRNINLIEKLKSRLLEDVSLLYANMLKLPPESRERTELLADIAITAYLLSMRMGTAPEDLEERMKSRLKREVLKDDDPLYRDNAAILKRLTKMEP